MSCKVQERPNFKERVSKEQTGLGDIWQYVIDDATVMLVCFVSFFSSVLRFI